MPPHRSQHRVDPPRRPGRPGPRPGQDFSSGPGAQARHVRARVHQPGHEQSELPDPRLPAPSRPGAPPQEQRDPARIRPRRRFRAIPAEPHLPQERIGRRHDRQLLIQHRPVPRTRRQLNHERSHPVIPRSRARRELLPATSTAPTEIRRETSCVPPLCNVTQQPGELPENGHDGAPRRTSGRGRGGPVVADEAGQVLWVASALVKLVTA